MINDESIPENNEAGEEKKGLGPEELIEKLQALAEHLLGKRNEAILFRSACGVERRWKEDQASFNGIDSDRSSKSILGRPHKR